MKQTAGDDDAMIEIEKNSSSVEEFNNKRGGGQDRIEEEEEEVEEDWPLWSSEEGDVDFSDAALVVLDAAHLKKEPEPVNMYGWFFQFARECRLKCCLQYFRHPGYSKGGPLAAFVGKRISKEEYKLAAIAIEKYQEVNQNVKLRLKELLKINFIGPGGSIFYMTFTAENEMTGETRPYQAALSECLNDEYVLGLFRDLIDDKILAILSITGSEEDRAPRQVEMQKEKLLRKDAIKSKKRKEAEMQKEKLKNDVKKIKKSKK